MKRCSIKSDRQFQHTLVSWLDRFVFAIVAATIFAFSICHWLIDINYKYTIDMNGIIIDVNHVFWIGAIASVYYLIRKKQVEFDFALVLLCTMMMFCSVIDYQKQNYVPVNYGWIIPIAYIVGKLIVGTDKATVNAKIITLYVVMAVPMYIQSFLDFWVNWREGWIYGTEHWPEFWTGVIDARTTYEMGFILTTSAMAFVIYIFKKHKFIALLIVAANILLEYILVHAQGRQNPVMLIITIGLYFCMLVYDKWSADNKKLKRVVLTVALAGVAFIVLLAVLFSVNAFGLMDMYKNSYWSDGGFLKNERFEINWNAFKSMLAWPTDDYETRAGLARGHSMVLEYGRTYDMTVYIGIAIVRIIFIVQAIRLVLKKSANAWIKYLIFPAFVCINLYHTMEPNAHAHRYLWMPGLFISGMIAGWLELDKKSQVVLNESREELLRKANLCVD